MSNSPNSHRLSDVPVVKKAWESDNRKTRRRSIIRDFALNTSTHALPGIARSQSKHNRAFWTISFLFFTGVMIYFVVQTILKYFQYPTQTSVSIVVERLQAFPAVTICNYSPARFDLLIRPFLNFTNSRNLTNTNDTSAFIGEQVALLADYLIEVINAGGKVDKYFFSLDVMLISCNYNGQSCTAADFISFLSPSYGFCYTFNARTKNQSSVRQTNQNSGHGKLQLYLYPHKQLYVPLISKGLPHGRIYARITPFLHLDVSVGMVAMVHDNVELPLIDAAGIELAPGRKHKLSYRKRSNYVLPAPYTDCTDRVSKGMQAMFDNYGGAEYAYSQDVCYILCIQAYVYSQCGCVSMAQWLARSIVLPGTDQLITASLCKRSSNCSEDATSRLSSSPDLWNQYCSGCTQACSMTDFIVTPSSVAAPAPLFSYLTKIFVESRNVSLPANWSTNWQTEVENNYVSLEVVSQSTLVENYTQNPSMSPVDVLSNVGGQTGLWIGISFLSVMEWVEMLYRLARHELNLVMRKIKRRMQINDR